MARKVKDSDNMLSVALITLGPAPELFPIVDNDFPAFSLPFLKSPLLLHTLEYLSKCTSKIFVQSIEKYRDELMLITSVYDSKVELLLTKEYEYVSYSLNLLRNRINSKYFILCEGDIFFRDSLSQIYERFVYSGDDIHAFISASSKDCPVISFDSDNYLCTYNTNDIPFRRHKKVFMTVEYSLYNFFLCKTQLLLQAAATVNSRAFGFRLGYVSRIVESGVAIKLNRTQNIQICDLVDIMRQIDVKNEITRRYGESMVGNFVRIHPTAIISDSVINDSCKIGRDTKIKGSVVFPESEIGSNCHITNCIIGSKVVIRDKCILTDCCVGNMYSTDVILDAKGACFCSKPMER